MPPPTPASVDLVWDEAHALAEAQERRHAALESKTIPLLAFGLTFIAFVRSSTAASPIGSAVKDALTVLIALGLLATLVAILPRKWGRVPKLTAFVEDANWEPQRLKERYFSDYMDAYTNNDEVLAEKFLWFKCATLIYLIALAAGIVAATIWPRG
ncbi:MAG: hypothetical protein AABM40_09630 [Chloroflexota bacterium]